MTELSDKRRRAAMAAMFPQRAIREYREKMALMGRFAAIRAKILSVAFPTAIVVCGDNIRYRYSEKVEQALGEVDKMEKDFIKLHIECDEQY